METGQDTLPELVRDSRLQATLQGDVTIHTRPPGRRGLSPRESWARERLLGNGGYGVVWLERKIETDENGADTSGARLRAVKCVKIPPSEPQLWARKYYVRELEALAKFSQDKYTEHFVKFFGWYQVTGWLHIAMEYCEHGDLKGYLSDNKTMPENQVQDIALQVTGALSLMHSERFAHRDLKPANILIKCKPPDNWWVKVADLGLSKRAESNFASSTVRGTEDFMAPETRGFPFHGDPLLANPFAADMWSLGEVVFRAITGRAAFDGARQLLDYQNDKVRFQTSILRGVSASPDVESLVLSLMSADPLTRMTAADTLRHPWLAAVHPEIGHGIPAEPTPIPISRGFSPILDEITEPSGHWTATMSHRGVVSGSHLSTRASHVSTSRTMRPSPAPSGDSIPLQQERVGAVQYVPMNTTPRPPPTESYGDSSAHRPQPTQVKIQGRENVAAVSWDHYRPSSGTPGAVPYFRRHSQEYREEPPSSTKYRLAATTTRLGEQVSTAAVTPNKPPRLSPSESRRPPATFEIAQGKTTRTRLPRRPVPPIDTASDTSSDIETVLHPRNHLETTTLQRYGTAADVPEVEPNNLSRHMGSSSSYEKSKKSEKKPARRPPSSEKWRGKQPPHDRLRVPQRPTTATPKKARVVSRSKRAPQPASVEDVDEDSNPVPGTVRYAVSEALATEGESSASIEKGGDDDDRVDDDSERVSYTESMLEPKRGPTLDGLKRAATRTNGSAMERQLLAQDAKLKKAVYDYLDRCARYIHRSRQGPPKGSDGNSKNHTPSHGRYGGGLLSEEGYYRDHYYPSDESDDDIIGDTQPPRSRPMDHGPPPPPILPPALSSPAYSPGKTEVSPRYTSNGYYATAGRGK